MRPDPDFQANYQKAVDQLHAGLSALTPRMRLSCDSLEDRALSAEVFAEVYAKVIIHLAEFADEAQCRADDIVGAMGAAARRDSFAGLECSLREASAIADFVDFAEEHAHLAEAAE